MSESIERQKSEYVTLSTHVLNLGTGMPQRGLEVSLLNEDGDFMAKGITDRSGRISEWKDTTGLVPGTYRLRFLLETMPASQIIFTRTLRSSFG